MALPSAGPATAKVQPFVRSTPLFVAKWLAAHARARLLGPMSARSSTFVRHAPALLAATGVLAAALWAGKTAAPVPAPAQVSVGPAPESDGSLLDACSRRVGCLKR